jgi:hypothetical protein
MSVCAPSVVGACGGTVHEVASEGGSEDARSGGDGGGVCSVQPPPPSSGENPSTVSHDYAISALFLGDTDRQGTSSADAWRSFGYDLDDKLTTASSTDVCTLVPGSPRQVQVDGDCGRDNSWGANIMPIILMASGVDPCPVGTCTDVSTDMIYAVGFDDSAGNMTSNLGLTGVILLGETFYDLATPPAFGLTSTWPVDPASVSGCTVVGGCPAGTDPVKNARLKLHGAYQAKGEFVSGAPVDVPITIDLPQGSTLPIVIEHAIVTFSPDRPGSVTNGTIAGVIPTEALVATLRQLAGSISASLCTSSALATLVTQFEQASDIVYDGATISNPAGQPCNAISIGLGFSATEIAYPTAIAPGSPQPPDVCGD